MTFTVLTYNNFVGIVTDAYLIKNIIYTNISQNVDVKFIDQLHDNDVADVGIWIQNFNTEQLNRFKKNIFFINEEWSGNHELSNLHLFDYVVCKTNYAKKLLQKYKDVICLPFISRNYYLDINRKHKYLHFAGRSIQKNTELILKQSQQITLLDPYSLHSPPNHFVHKNKYQTQEELQLILNTHNIHLCTSLYESWGHYLYEGLSTGNEIICSDIPAFTENLDPDLVQFVPTKINLDYTYSFDKQNQNGGFPIRQSFHIEQQHLKDIIDNFEPIGKNEERRKLFKNIIDKNIGKLIEFFKNL
jgi:hypothetical protein